MRFSIHHRETHDDDNPLCHCRGCEADMWIALARLHEQDLLAEVIARNPWPWYDNYRKIRALADRTARSLMPPPWDLGDTVAIAAGVVIVATGIFIFVQIWRWLL